MFWQRGAARAVLSCAPDRLSAQELPVERGPGVETVKSSREIERMFDGGSRASHPLLIVLATKRSAERGPGGRVAFIAGKKLGNAVHRNRCKRVLRETARRADAPWAGYDVALIARPTTASASSRDIDAALDTALRRLGVIR